MADCILIRLKNLSPLHIGTGKENYDFAASSLQSDTLSAALAALKAQRGSSGHLDEFLASFTLSSAFPYIGNRYFMPKPMGKYKRLEVFYLSKPVYTADKPSDCHYC